MDINDYYGYFEYYYTCYYSKQIDLYNHAGVYKFGVFC